jgi:hypothetical protein
MKMMLSFPRWGGGKAVRKLLVWREHNASVFCVLVRLDHERTWIAKVFSSFHEAAPRKEQVFPESCNAGLLSELSATVNQN